MPLPIDIEVEEGTTIDDGWQTLTHKDASHIRFLSVDPDGFLVYEITPPKKVITKPLKEYFGEEQLIASEATIVDKDGQPVCQYKYFRRGDGSYYACIVGQETEPHKIELGKLTDRESPIFTIAKTIAYRFDTKKFSRKDLKPFLPKILTYFQKFKSLLDVLHHEGFLVKEIDQTSRNKAKELYNATDKLKKFILPSPSPEQA